MINARKYDAQIDVWSMGCIIGEMLGGKVLFPGKDYLQQLCLIVYKIGQPSKDDLEAMSNPPARAYIEGMGDQKKVAWDKEFPEADPLLLDLLDKMLAWNPKKRITVDEALRHKYFSKLYKASHIRECKPFNFDWEDQPLNKDSLRELMWEEICHFRPYLRTSAPAKEGKRRESEEESQDKVTGETDPGGSKVEITTGAPITKEDTGTAVVKEP